MTDMRQLDTDLADLTPEQKLEVEEYGLDMDPLQLMLMVRNYAAANRKKNAVLKEAAQMKLPENINDILDR